MNFYMAGMRKRTLSSDTTDSSENEDGGVSPIYNLYGQNEDGQRRGKTKVARQGFWAGSNAKEDNSSDKFRSDSSRGEQSGISMHENKTDKGGGNYSSFAQKLMADMGYVEGKGLGKNEQGRVDIVESSKQRGRRGLGLQLAGLEANEDAKWILDEEEEAFLAPEWIPECDIDPPTSDEMQQWSKIGERKEFINNETQFCDPEVLQKMLDGKNVFDMLGADEFLRARTRSNPHETIRGGIFQNRAAMKMAELDATFDFMFTNPKDERGLSTVSSHELLYFADICAGPGGFSEYILWRKKWHSKGFGLTLKGDGSNDFKLSSFLAGSPETFEPHYGVGGYDGDGDIFREDNLTEFRNFVVENSDMKGVHFVMADGGFSVEGQENIQEILSKQLYLCQFLCALSILRPGGHFVCKLFDIFTPFSVGCIYLLYRAFKQVCIFKPVTSRPANSERYVICKWKLADTGDIHDYMFNLNQQINKMKGSKQDVNEVVPIDLLRDDAGFFDYIYTSNNFLGQRQAKSLLKLKIFVQNTSLTHPNQGDVRKLCLAQWKVPDEVRAAVNRTNPDNRFISLIKNLTINVEMEVLTESVIDRSLKNILDFKCTVAAGTRVFLLSLGRFHIFKWEPKNPFNGPNWTRIDDPNFELPRDTLLEAEIVEEFRGEGRGQRRLQAVHIVDAIYLGGDFIGDKPLKDRIISIELFVKALAKPSRPSMTSLRCKKIYRLYEIHKVFDRMRLHQMKTRGEQKLCFDVSDDRYYIPTGLHFFKCVKDPWSMHHSRKQKKLFFFNSSTGASLFESPGQDSIADYQYCLNHRLIWHWQDEEDFYTPGKGRINLGKDTLLEFLRTKAQKIDLA